MHLSLAISPCPNDTFMFHQLVADRAARAWTLDVSYHDVETLNQRAADETYDLTKLSFYAYLLHRRAYRLLDAGAALGFGCGPLLVARRPLDRADLAGLRVAVPGELTTAHLLFQLWAEGVGERVFTTYDRILDAVSSGRVDCGILIHESRFTYQQVGLNAVVDLGAWWEQRTGLPLPLGCIAARTTLPPEVVQRFASALRQSIENARRDPSPALAFARRYAKELSEDVLAQHVETFVNEFSLDLGERGRAAVRELERMANAAGVLS